MEGEFRDRGRVITAAEVDFIRQLIAQHPEANRRQPSLKLCEAWGWKQPNGTLRDTVCRGLLLEQQRTGRLELPPASQPRTRRRAKKLGVPDSRVPGGSPSWEEIMRLPVVLTLSIGTLLLPQLGSPVASATGDSESGKLAKIEGKVMDSASGGPVAMATLTLLGDKPAEPPAYTTNLIWRGSLPLIT